MDYFTSTGQRVRVKDHVPMHGGKTGTVRLVSTHSGNEAAWVHLDGDVPSQAVILDPKDPRKDCIFFEASECDPVTQHPSFPESQ